MLKLKSRFCDNIPLFNFGPTIGTGLHLTHFVVFSNYSYLQNHKLLTSRYHHEWTTPNKIIQELKKHVNSYDTVNQLHSKNIKNIKKYVLRDNY